MADPKPHCSVDYHKFNGNDLDTKAHLVSEGIYTNNPPFTAPPMPQVDFEVLVTNHHDKYEDYKNGGKAQKGPYQTARTALITAMDTTGDYVDTLPGVDDDMILLAGFTPTKTGESSAVTPGVPDGIELTHGAASGELFAECAAQTGVSYYGCILVAAQTLPGNVTLTASGQIIATGNPVPPPAMAAAAEQVQIVILDVTKGRKKHFTGLVKGVEYFIYFYAGNTAGVSQLSEVKSILCL